MDGWMAWWMDGKVAGWKGGWIEGCMGRSVNGWIARVLSVCGVQFVRGCGPDRPWGTFYHTTTATIFACTWRQCQVAYVLESAIVFCAANETSYAVSSSGRTSGSRVMGSVANRKEVHFDGCMEITFVYCSKQFCHFSVTGKSIFLMDNDSSFSSCMVGTTCRVSFYAPAKWNHELCHHQFCVCSAIIRPRCDCCNVGLCQGWMPSNFLGGLLAPCGCRNLFFVLANY